MRIFRVTNEIKNGVTHENKKLSDREEVALMQEYNKQLDVIQDCLKKSSKLNEEIFNAQKKEFEKAESELQNTKFNVASNITQRHEAANKIINDAYKNIMKDINDSNKSDELSKNINESLNKC